MDKERTWLLDKERYLVDNDLDESNGVSLSEVYERLDQIDSDSAQARAAMVLAGLGFDAAMQQMTTREFSGGWRMRIALAQARGRKTFSVPEHHSNAADGHCSDSPVAHPSSPS